MTTHLKVWRRPSPAVGLIFLARPREQRTGLGIPTAGGAELLLGRRHTLPRTASKRIRLYSALDFISTHLVPQITKMKLSSLAFLAGIVAIPSSTYAFVQPTLGSMSTASTSYYASGYRSALFASNNDDDDEPQEPVPPSRSQIEGNQRAPTAQELSLMDDMITKLAAAEPYELPGAVSKAIRVVSSPQFFLRIANRADQETDAEMKARLMALSENLVQTIQAVVSTMEERLDDRAKDVESVVKAAAEPDSGEFLVPLSAERVDAMRDALGKLDSATLDEGFLSTVDAWMNKSHQDGMDGMVGILQKVLQMYAGMEIKRARAELQANVGAAVSGKSQATADEVLAEEERQGPKPAAALMERLMEVDADLWNVEMRKRFEDAGSGVTSKALLGEVQRTIEGVVLGLENGSMAQRVQAEFLKELVQRIEALEKQMS